jgi:hypothetical protein
MELALWQEVSLGISKINTEKDFICAECWNDGVYTCTPEGVCQIHSGAELLPEWVIENNLKFAGQYERKLRERESKRVG